MVMSDLSPWNKGKIGCQIAWNKGLTKETDDRVRKMSDTRKGQKRTLKTCLKMRNAQLGKKQSKEHIEKRLSKIRGIPLSDRTKKKIGDALRGRTYVMSDWRKEKIRLGTIKRIEHQKLNGLPLIPCIGKYETKILDILEECFYPFIIKRQYRVAGYFLDGYCPALRLAIEVDEMAHNKQEKLSKDIYRENQIKQKLNCQFIRIDI